MPPIGFSCVSEGAPVEGFGRQSHGATKFAQHGPYGDISAKKLAQYAI